MTRSLAGQVPNLSQITAKLDGARYQIDALERLPPVAVEAESCACAAIDQMLQALAATLDGLNQIMPDPLPARRVTRKNVRDRFLSVGSESRALQAMDAAVRAGRGWLWWLELKASGSAFARLLAVDETTAGPAGIWRDPLEHAQGQETGGAGIYLMESLGRVTELIDQALQVAPADAAAYRRGLEQQTRRLL